MVAGDELVGAPAREKKKRKEKRDEKRRKRMREMEETEEGMRSGRKGVYIEGGDEGGVWEGSSVAPSRGERGGRREGEEKKWIGGREREEEEWRSRE